jgi:hypothetical protein
MNPHTGFGALILKGDGNSPENFVAVMGVKSITGPNIQRGTHETTDMQSPDGWKQFIGGLVDAGEVSFEANLLPSDPTQNQESGGFMAEFDKTSCDSLANWRISFPVCAGEPEGYLGFEGIATGQNMTFPLDDLMGFQGSLKVSGRPEIVLAS